MSPFTLQTVGWSALINAVAGVTSFIALVLFFALGGLWGPINDALSVVWALSLIPLAWLLLQINRPVHPAWSMAATFVGIASMLLFAALQFLLVVGVVRYEQTVNAIMILIGLAGAWQIGSGWMARGGGALPSRLVWALVASGLGLLLSAAGFWLGGAENPIAAVGFVVGMTAGTVWAAWLVRLLWAGSLPLPA